MNSKRRTYAQWSVLCWMHKGETYAEAKKRLDAEWENGTHPAQR